MTLLLAAWAVTTWACARRAAAGCCGLPWLSELSEGEPGLFTLCPASPVGTVAGVEAFTVVGVSGASFPSLKGSQRPSLQPEHLSLRTGRLRII